MLRINGVPHSIVLFVICSTEIGECNDAKADDVNTSASEPTKTPVRVDKAHPLIVRPQEYPAESARRGEKGSCAIRMEVDFDGPVRAKQFVVSTGFERLDVACLAAFADARFIPATLDGKPAASWINAPIDWGRSGYVGETVTDDQLAEPFIRKDYELRVGPRFYQPSSPAMHQEGDCTIHVLVKDDGTAGDISVIKSTGFASLDEACLAAIQQAPFESVHSNRGTLAAVDIHMSWRIPKQQVARHRDDDHQVLFRVDTGNPVSRFGF
jgi:TonB family protein